MSTRAIALIFWIAAGFIVAELAVEYRAYSRGYDTLLFSRRAPEDPAASNASSTRYGPTDAFPFRSPIVPVERPALTTRFWVSSSSHAEDDLLPKSQIFPNVLARILDRSGRPAEVLNASRAGELISDNIRDLDALAPEWRPDYVILYQMSLDVSALSNRFLGGMEAAEPGVPSVDHAAPQEPNWTVRLVESTTLYALLKVNVTSRFTQSRVLARDLPEPAMEEFHSRLLDFIEAVRAQGSTPVLCTFATMHDRSDLGNFSANAITSIFRFNVHLSLEGWVDAIERLNETILEVARQEGVAVVDIGRALGGHSELFRDFVHFTPTGHERVAEVLASELPSPGERGGIGKGS